MSSLLERANEYLMWPVREVTPDNIRKLIDTLVINDSDSISAEDLMSAYRDHEFEIDRTDYPSLFPGTTLLTLACQRRATGLIKILLNDMVADPNELDDVVISTNVGGVYIRGQTPLDSLLIDSGNLSRAVDGLNLLLDAGATDVNEWVTDNIRHRPDYYNVREILEACGL